MPRKVALLMSAAGLGLSLPALAVAQGDACAWPSVESEAGLPAPTPLDCLRWARNAQMPYRLSTAGLLGTGNDDAAMFESPLDSSGASCRPTSVHDCELTAQRRRNELPEVEAQPVAALTADGVYHDYDPSAIAMVLMADAPIQTHAQALSAPAPAGEPDALAGEEPRSAKQLQPPAQIALRAGHPEGAGPPTSTPIRRALNDLARIADSRADEPAPHSGTAEQHVEWQGKGAEEISGIVAVDAAPWALAHVGEDIVVATHVDRVLMSLDTILSDEAGRWGRIDARPRQTVVATQSEKVLETLALFKKRAAQRHIDEALRSPPPMGANAACPMSPAQMQDVLRNCAAALVAGATAESNKLGDDGRAVVQIAGSAEAPKSRRTHPVGDQALVLSGERLDSVRGGFVGENGLKISFGIERTVYLNGSLVATNSLNVSDLSKITGGQAQVTSSSTGTLALIQSGQGNTFLPSFISQTAGGLVIQNALDNQSIQSITRINAVVNSSGIIRSMNLQSSMRSAVIDSLRR